MPKRNQYSSAAKPRSKYQRRYNSQHRPENAARKKARRLLQGEGRVKPFDGRDVHHRDGNPRNNSRRNLLVSHQGRNRAKH
jgi:hypothetical protein